MRPDNKQPVQVRRDDVIALLQKIQEANDAGELLAIDRLIQNWVGYRPGHDYR